MAQTVSTWDDHPANLDNTGVEDSRQAEAGGGIPK